MKYLLKFNEAYAEYQITDRDTEIIENCFLEYLDQTYQGEYVPSKTICGKPSDYIIFKFDIPHPQPHELITWSDSVASEQLDDYKSDENL